MAMVSVVALTSYHSDSALIWWIGKLQMLIGRDIKYEPMLHLKMW